MLKQGDRVLYSSAAWPGCGGCGTVEYYDKFVMMYQVRKEDGTPEWFVESNLRPAEERKMFKIGDVVQVTFGDKRLLAEIEGESYSGTLCKVWLEDDKRIWIDKADLEQVIPEEQKPCWPTHIPVVPEISAAALERIKKRVFEGIADLERTRRRELWEKYKDESFVILELQRPPYTCVSVGVLTKDPIGVGFAKCLPTDKWSAQTGKDIAKGRAIADLLDKLVKLDKMGESCRG